MKERKQKPPPPEPIIFGGFDAVAEIAKKLVASTHPHLASAKIEFFSRSKAQKHGGRQTPGTIKKASPFEKHLVSQFRQDHEEPDYIMIVALDVWNLFQPSQRTALVDHLLTHCVAEENEQDGSMKYSIQPPDVQEFAEIVGRHGKWNEPLQELAHQLEK